MTSQPKRRWLPRFGLRSLFALVLVVAAYFGSWPWVNEQARRDIKSAAMQQFKRAGGPGAIYALDYAFEPTVVAPYLLTALDKDSAVDWNLNRRYYLWLFGWTVRLPITSPEPGKGHLQPKELKPIIGGAP